MSESPAKSKEKHNQRIPFFSRLQVKYALSYLALLAVVLVLLNTYPLIASQDLLVSSKQDTLRSQTAVMSSALMELESLSADQVARVMNMLDNMGLENILVTDPSGLILYDSLLQQEEEPEAADPPPDPALPGGETPAPEPTYSYALFQEVVLALLGNDVFYSHYEDGIFLSTAASPIVYRGMVIGAIYICDWDNTQGELLHSLQLNLRTISLVLVVIALTISFFFSKILTSRIGALLRAIRVVGEGEYGHRLQPAGRDELAHLAEEFNQLTDRLQTTEEVRRRFVSDASHELKTPLASIQLLTDSILQNQEMDSATIQEFVGDIGDEAERLTRITEHLLSLTRLDSLPVGETYVVDLSTVARRAFASVIRSGWNCTHSRGKVSCSSPSATPPSLQAVTRSPRPTRPIPWWWLLFTWNIGPYHPASRLPGRARTGWTTSFSPWWKGTSPSPRSWVRSPPAHTLATPPPERPPVGPAPLCPWPGRCPGSPGWPGRTRPGPGRRLPPGSSRRTPVDRAPAGRPGRANPRRRPPPAHS